MLIDKEYPATHSMSTAWYIVDEDGNVGIMESDELGPVVADTSPLLDDDDNIDMSGKTTTTIYPEFSDFNKAILGKSSPSFEYRNLNLKTEYGPASMSDEQIFNLLENPRIPNEDSELEEDTIVQIDITNREEFIDLTKNKDIEFVSCLSYDNGLYAISPDESLDDDTKSETFAEMIKQGLISKIYNLKSAEKLQSDSPFYLYVQKDMEDGQRRIAVPKNPVKASQLPQDLKLVHFPFKFSEHERMQFCEYYHFYEHFPSFYFCKKFSYYPKTFSNNEKVYVFGNMWKEPKFPIALGIVADSRWKGIFINWEYTFGEYTFFIAYSLKHFWDHFGLRKQPKETVLEKLPLVLDKIKLFADLLNPYYVYLDEETEEIIGQFFEKTDSTITINGVTLPYFCETNINSHLEEIEHFNSLPYRGKKLPRILKMD